MAGVKYVWEDDPAFGGQTSKQQKHQKTKIVSLHREARTKQLGTDTILR